MYIFCELHDILMPHVYFLFFFSFFTFACLFVFFRLRTKSISSAQIGPLRFVISDIRTSQWCLLLCLPTLSWVSSQKSAWWLLDLLSSVARNIMRSSKPRHPLAIVDFPLLCWNFLHVIRPNGTLFHLLGQSGWGKRISEHPT